MLGHVIRCHTSTEIWIVLQRLIATKSKEHILQIKGLLLSTKKWSMAIDDYILKMKICADSLAEARVPISDDSLCLYILGGLRSEYEATVVNFTNKSEPLTIQDVQYSLHTQEMWIQRIMNWSKRSHCAWRGLGWFVPWMSTEGCGRMQRTYPSRLYARQAARTKTSQ